MGKNNQESIKNEISIKEKHPTAPPRLEGKVKNTGIKSHKKEKQEN